jgi:hypothetical protein
MMQIEPPEFVLMEAGKFLDLPDGIFWPAVGKRVNTWLSLMNFQERYIFYKMLIDRNLFLLITIIQK